MDTVLKKRDGHFFFVFFLNFFFVLFNFFYFCILFLFLRVNYKNWYGLLVPTRSSPSAGNIAVIVLNHLFHTATALFALLHAAVGVGLVLLALLVQRAVPGAGRQGPLVAPARRTAVPLPARAHCFQIFKNPIFGGF